MQETEWDKYGTGNYEKCADCMVHCGYEPTAVADTFVHPLKALKVAIFGPRTDGPFAPDIPLEGARSAEQRHDLQVYDFMRDLPRTERDRRWFEAKGLTLPEAREPATDRADQVAG